MNPTNRKLAATAAACLLTLGLAACGDDDDSAAVDTVPAADTEDSTPAKDDGEDGGDAEVLEITAVDYGFEGLPDTIEAGTRLSLTNEGDEPHELVAMRIPDEETRSLEELLELPEPELMGIFGEDTAPATVILAATGSTDTPGPVVGDGTITEPGRYAIVCFLPVGSDDSVLESEGPPQGDAPPHISQGMWAEVEVQ